MQYVRPQCGSQIWLRTTFAGWELEKVAENTGEAYKLIESERTEIFDVGYGCSSSKCGWVGFESWFDNLEEKE